MSGLRIMRVFLMAVTVAATLGARAFPVQKTVKPEGGLTKQKQAAIASVVQEAIHTGKCPGAVLVVG